MATDKKIVELPALAESLAAGDLLEVVNVSDTTDDPTGSSARVAYSDVLAGVTVPTGATLYVDAVNGSDATGTRGDAKKPFLTLTAAQTAAQSGDLIAVRPGSYAVTSQLGKNGVNWWFDAGAAVTWTEADTAVSGMWLGSGFGLTYQVRGYGKFTRTVTARTSSVFPCILSLTAQASDVVLEGTDFTVTDTSSATNPPRVIHHTNGTLTVRCRDMTCNGAVGTGGSDTTGAGVWWQNGTLHVTGRRVVATAWGLYSEVTTSPTGDAYAEFDDWRTGLACVYCAGTQGTAAVWTRGKTYRNLTFGDAVFVNGAERLYVEGEKIFGRMICASTGLLYVRSQKVSPVVAANPLLSVTGGTAWVGVDDWDSTGCTGNVIAVSGGTVDVIGGTVRGDSASLGATFSGGTARLHGVSINTSLNSSTNPITVSAAGLTLAAVELVAAGGRDAVTAGSAQTVTLAGPASYNTTISANVTFSSRSFAPQSFAGTVTATAFSGDGSALTALNATQLTTGTVADARLSSNVPLKNATNAFTGKNTFLNSTTSGTAEPWLDVESQASATGLVARFKRTGDTSLSLLMLGGVTYLVGSGQVQLCFNGATANALIGYDSTGDVIALRSDAAFAASLPESGGVAVHGRHTYSGSVLGSRPLYFTGWSTTVVGRPIGAVYPQWIDQTEATRAGRLRIGAFYTSTFQEGVRIDASAVAGSNPVVTLAGIVTVDSGGQLKTDVVGDVSAINVRAAVGNTAPVIAVRDPVSSSVVAGFDVTGAVLPPELADADAPLGSIYFSTTASKLVYKDSGGVVHALY